MKYKVSFTYEIMIKGNDKSMVREDAEEKLKCKMIRNGIYIFKVKLKKVKK